MSFLTSGHTSAVKGAVHRDCSATANPALQRRGATVHEDSIENVTTREEETLLRCQHSMVRASLIRSKS